MLGTHRYPAGGRLPAHSRIRLFIWCGQPQGRNLYLPDPAGTRYRMLPNFSGDLGEEILQGIDPAFCDGAGNHCSDELEIPANIILHLLPPYSPELNPQENIWDEIREKIFKNSALKSMSDVNAKLDEASLYIERSRTLVKSIASFPYIAKSY